MFKKLHLQLTFFCTLITSLILVTMSVISLGIAEKGNRINSYTSFLNNVNTALSYLENQNILSHDWFAQMKAGYGLDIRIYDNGDPLIYNYLRDQEFPDAVLEQAFEKAKLTHALDLKNTVPQDVLSQHGEFSMRGQDGVDYYVSAAVLPKRSGSLSVLILYSRTGEQMRQQGQRILFGLVDVGAIIILAIFSWFFTKRVIHPIAENRRRQMQFIAAASHELRSPLTVILSSLSAMKVAGPEESESFAGAIQSEGTRMSRLISDMLVLANADNGSWSINPEPLELDTLVLQTYEKYESLAREKNLTLAVSLPEQVVPPCTGDGERIAQVLSILIENAFSYTPPGGHIALNLTTLNNRARICVADNGPGVPDQDKPLIFERFYRADKAHKSKSHFGLGLCIAQEIVKLHKGKLELEDTPGGGATFSIVLPL